MKRRNRIRRMAAGVLACILLFSVMITPVLGVGAVKQSTTRAIAIVFDNSGSMYMNQNKAWCRATYAIEVFASMMNEGDTLQVYPMYPVQVNGVTYDSKDKPFTISGGADTSVIQTMYSPYAGDTPIETIGDAYNGLKKQKADEKWLIVLTDGAVFYENEVELGSEQDTEPTKTRLEEVLTEYNRDVNVLYLGIDPKAVIPEVTESSDYQYHTAKAADSRDTLTRLTEMCNMIFGRDILATSGNKMTFDVSMNKLILFVQGEDISNVDLKNSAGVSVGSPTQAYSPQYGELGVGSLRTDGTAYTKWAYDDSLSGYIAVYDIELDAGTYTMSYSGDVSSVSVYYEPDVKLNVMLKDANGASVKTDTVMYSGLYTIYYGLMDKNDEMTTSKLLGKTNYTMTYIVNGEAKTVQSDKSGKIELQLEEGDTLDGKFSVTYLSGYTINKSGLDFNWPSGGFQIQPRPVGLLELKVSGGQDSYNLSELETGSYAVQLIYEGAPLTAEQMADAQLSVAVEGGNVGYTLEPTDGGYVVNLTYSGPAGDTVCGPYTLQLQGSFVNEHGKTSETGVASIPFSVVDDGYQLEMEVEGGDYFVLSKLDQSEPIMVYITADGQPLTDEQLAGTTLTVDGLDCTCTPVPGESAYEVRIAGATAKTGKYTMAIRAAAQDQVGRAISVEDEHRVTLKPYPRWLPFLIVCLALLLIFALIWLYLSMKVLPKKIEVDKSRSSFTINGEDIPCTVKCNPTVFGKRTGSIQVSVPKYADDMTLKGTVTLNLTAVSPRRVKSSARQAMVTSVALSSAVAQKASIGSHDLLKNDDGDTPIWTFDGKEVGARPNVSNTSFTISGSPVITISGVTQMENDFILRAQLKFK